MKIDRWWVGWLAGALLIPAACGGGDSYQLTLSPESVNAEVIQSFTVDLLTEFDSGPPIYTTHVAVTSEPGAIVSNLGAGDIEYRDQVSNTDYDLGPPPTYSFRPPDEYQAAVTQRLTFRCLGAGDATITVEVNWTGGNPEDEEIFSEIARATVAAHCE